MLAYPRNGDADMSAKRLYGSIERNGLKRNIDEREWENI